MKNAVEIVKMFVLILVTLVLVNLIYKATEMNNFVVAGALALVALVIVYFGMDLVVKNLKFKQGVSGSELEINDDDEGQNGKD